MACQEFTGNKIMWNLPKEDHQNQLVPPGDYEYEYKLCIGTCTKPELIKTFKVKITVEDPCANPTFGTPGAVAPEYTITDFAKTFTLDPKYTIDPSWCPGQLVITAPGIEDNVSVDQNTQEVTFSQITDSLEKSGRNDPSGI